MTPAELWCEYAVDPLGIDVPEPRFGWTLDSSRRGEVQSAYRILVATHNSLQEGEIYDARLEVPGWDAPGFGAEGWSDARQVETPAGTLFSQLMPPMKVIETRHPERLTNPRAGVYVFDFGQLFGGWIRIRLQGAAGTRVLIKHSSRLRPDGTIDDAAYPGPHESDTCVLRGDPGGETYEPRFTFHPVHYVRPDGSLSDWAPELPGSDREHDAAQAGN